MVNKLIKVETAFGPAYIGSKNVGQIYTDRNYIQVRYPVNQYVELYWDSSQKGQLTSDSLVSGTTHTLIDTNATFVTDGVEVGDWVESSRFPSGSYVWLCKVTAVVSETELTIDEWQGGTISGLGSAGQHYSIKAGTQPYNNAAAKISEAIATATTTSAKSMIIDLPECSDKFGPITFYGVDQSN